MPLLTLLAVLGAFLGTPNPWLHIPLLALLFPLGLTWLSFRASTPKHAFRWGMLAGWLASVSCVYWVAGPVAQYGGLPWWLAFPCPLLLAIVLGMYHAIYVWLMHRAARRFSPVWLCIFAAIFWAALEQIGSWMLTGFPWITLSASFSPWPFLIQGASLVGAYGLSGLFAALATALVLWNTGRGPRYFALSLLLFLAVWGGFREASVQPQGPSRTITLVQGNIDQSMKWDTEFQIATVEKFLSMSLDAVREHTSDLVIWPETAMPFYLQDSGIFSNQIKEFSTLTGTALLTGSPAYEINKKDGYSYYNRAFLFRPDGTMSWYDKVHLVPFGEYVPLSWLLPLDKLTQGVGDYRPGTQLSPLAIDSLQLGALVCYEIIFPSLAQERVESGANVLVTISNDAWFGRSSAPWQHLAQARIRAVEQSRWVVRGTNTGISAFIDPLGRMPLSSDLFTDETLTLPIKPVQVTTIYHDVYHVLTWSIYILGALFAAACFSPGRSSIDL